MPKLFKWNKWGDLWVYEGDYFVIAGNDELGYAVMSKCSNPEIIKPNKVSSNYIGYIGNFDTKKEALDMFRKLEQASKLEGATAVLIGDSEIHQAGGGFALGFPDTNAAILVAPMEHPEDLVHEFAHYVLGHPFKRRYRKVEQEKKALEFEIGELKKLGKYTPARRQRTIKMLAGYLDGDEEEARRIVGEIERRVDAEGETVLPDVVLRALEKR